MTKQEIINKYGIEYYERRKAQMNACHKKRYDNDATYRKQQQIECNKRRKEYYVKDGKLELIQNYELAKADNFKGWTIHHKLELHSDYSLRFTRESLIKLDLYYNRPPNELIWMRTKEHIGIHNKSRIRN